MRGMFTLAMIAGIAISGPALAGDTRVEAPIRQMEQGFNTGDIKLARSTHIASPDIVDEIAPFHWSGKGAFDRWIGDLLKSEKAEGKSDGVVKLGDPLVEKVSSGRAYVVVPSSYTFKQGGKTLRETGTMAFVLAKTKAGWKIAAWTWSSPEGVPIS